MQADIVHDEYLVVRSIVWVFLGESFVGDQDYHTCTKKSSCPKHHAEDLDEDRNYIEFLLLVGILHDLNECSDGTSVQEDDCHDCPVSYVVSSGIHDFLERTRNILTDN